MPLNRDSTPSLRRGVRRRFDETRGENILLAPERVIVLDETAAAITEFLDGKNAISKIANTLAERFSEDPAIVEADVVAFIEGLIEKSLATA